MKTIKEARLIETFADGAQDWYWRMKLPMMSDRDMLMRMKETKLDGERTFVTVKSIERPDTPLVKSVIRMYFQSNVMVRPNPESPGDTIDYTEITNFEMGGSVPARLMNMILTAET